VERKGFKPVPLSNDKELHQLKVVVFSSVFRWKEYGYLITYLYQTLIYWPYYCSRRKGLLTTNLVPRGYITPFSGYSSVFGMSHSFVSNANFSNSRSKHDLAISTLRSLYRSFIDFNRSG